MTNDRAHYLLFDITHKLNEWQSYNQINKVLLLVSLAGTQELAK